MSERTGHVFIENSDFSDSEKMAQYLEEERHMREENLRLQRKLQREMERREALCRQLSESESSLEMDDERCALVLCLFFCLSLVYFNKGSKRFLFTSC